ncbi:MAG: hypothetical protein JWO56_3616 [Acidobacteria bacterium]|nr:hypothetical protein [Acidobacteriota bacterium]
MREWCRLTRRQRILLVAVAVVVALTRLAALSRTLWDWDEVLFSTALHHYDVAAHHPHPPGFPLYVLLGRLVRLVIRDDFHALQAINLAAAMLLFPAVYLLARAFRFDFATSISAALLFSFLPNVLFFGGTAFSDLPSLVLLVFAMALLLRGRESRRDFLFGCALLGLALAFRPQNLLVAAYPLLAASWARLRDLRLRTAERWRDLLMGAAIVTSIVVVSYGGAAYVTGVDAYRVAIRKHSDYLMVIDSYRNPIRPRMTQLLPRFLLHPFGGSRVVVVLCIAAAIALLAAGPGRHPRRPPLEVLATFAPFFLTGVLLLNVESSSRYSMTWLVGICLLAAEGLRALAALLPERLRIYALAAMTLVIVAKEARFAERALREPRTTVSPTIAAVRWIRAHVPLSSTLYVNRDMQAFADAYLGDYTQAAVRGDGSFDVRDARGAWLVREWSSPSPDAVNFVRARHELFDLVRQRYFEVSVQPLSDSARFTDGWYDPESNGVNVWRWMGQRSTTLLPPISGTGELWLKIYLPLDAARRPAVTVTLNGQVVDRFVCTTAEVERTYQLPSRLGAPNELRLETDRILNPGNEHLADDGRDLGLQLRGIAWRGR